MLCNIRKVVTMGKFFVQMINLVTGAIEEVMDEEFDTYEEAEEYAEQCSSDFSAGGEVLDLAGEPSLDSDDYDYEVVEK